MTDENTIDNEANNDKTDGIVENYHRSLLPSPSSSLPLKLILETSNNSTIERSVHNVLRKHFLEQRPVTWKPIKVELVVNTTLTDDFFAVRKKFEKVSGGNRSEFEEHYGFLIENDVRIAEICNNGYNCIESSFNVLGHSKCGVYVCKYADVCIRQASVRRTWEGNMIIKMIVFKIVEGKQTAALVRKGPKLQPIAPTPQFTSHSSVITPKETDDLEKQFDQSQIFLYEFEGRETLKRPHHCLPYAIVSLIQDGTQWPTNFDNLDTEADALETDSLRVIAQADDPLLQNKLKDNLELAEAATLALEHIYEEESASLPVLVEQQGLSPSTDPDTSTKKIDSDSTYNYIVNGIGISSSSTIANEILSRTSPSPTVTPTTNIDTSSNPVVPPPLPASSTVTTNSTSKTPATAVATTIPLAHSAAAVQVACRQQTSLLGALPTAAALRAAPGAVYGTAAGLPNGLNGQIIYCGTPLDSLRGYQTATAGTPSYVFAAHAGQTIQQPTLYTAQLQAAAQQQQAAQLAAVAAAAQQQQQQQQQSLINGIPAGYMLVRTANGGIALLAQSSQASATPIQPRAQVPLAQQQYISLNAACQPAATTPRLPVAMVGGQSQQIVYQLAGQPTTQATPTQYIQLPTSLVQQHQLSTNPALQATTSAVSQAYTSHPPTHYIGASQSANHNNNTNVSSSNSSSAVSSSVVGTTSSVVQSQPTSTLISPQKQSAASATAAALQQQQQYQHSQYSQQQASSSVHGTNVYYAAIAQAQAQLSAQVQAQQQTAAAAALAQQQQQHQQQQQQQQLNLISQMQYSAQQGVPQHMYYATPGGQTLYQAGGQNYVLAQAAPAAGSTTSTGAPVMYSAGPALHNGSVQQQNQQHSSQPQQQQIGYQVATATGQPSAAAYQMLSTATNATQQAAATGAGVVAQQPAQLVQRPSVISQVRHHPYRN